MRSTTTAIFARANHRTRPPVGETMGDSAWRSMISAFAFRSCWATPISSRDGKSWALSRFTPSSPNADAAAATGHRTVRPRRGHRRLSRAKRRMLSEVKRFGRSAAYQSHRQLVVGVAATTHWSKETYSIYRFDPPRHNVRANSFSRHPEDLPMMYEVIELARGDGNDFEYEHRC